MRPPILHPFLGRPFFSTRGRQTPSSRHRRRRTLSRRHRSSYGDRSSASYRRRWSSHNDRTNPPTRHSDQDRAQVQSHQDRAQCGKRYVRDDDRISQLPDDILVDIISLLSLKEAARTSVLSSRWMNVWKYTTYLNFDVDSALDRIRREKSYEIRYKMRYILGQKYFEWVNRVVRSNKAPILKEFRICFPLDMTSGDVITQWLEFSFSRQVQRLELDLQNYCHSSEYYCFPEEFIAQNSSGAPKMHFKSLRELSFINIHVTDRAVEFFLNNCPLLEKLVIHRSGQMSKLEVCGSSLMLKHLEIFLCMGLKSLKVSAPSLTSLRTTTSEGLLLENVPMLVDVFLNCREDESSLRRLFSTLSCCISQLEILRLRLIRVGKGRNHDLCKFVELPKLRKLVIEYLGLGYESLGTVAALIRSSPYIEEFVLKNEWCQLPELLREAKEVKNVVKSPHHHLKIVKFSGFYGRTNDREMVSYILENCVVLSKLIIDPKRERPCKTLDTSDVEQFARNNANQQLQVPAHVELVIL